MAEPFYSDNMTQLYLGDCIQGMRDNLGENLYDLIVTSPPYNVGKSYEEGVDFGDYLKLLYGFYREGFRVIKRGGYCIVIFADFMTHFTGGRHIPMEIMHHILAERAGWVHRSTRVWKKDFATLEDKYSISTLLPKQEIEHIVCFRKPGGGREKVREHEWHSKAVWDTTGAHQSISARKLHTAGFPEQLVSIILTVYSGEGDTVIEPFCGSGTALAVAKMMGRRSIGFEINPQYAEGARLRICQQTMEQAMFQRNEVQPGNQPGLGGSEDEHETGDGEVAQETGIPASSS